MRRASGRPPLRVEVVLFDLDGTLLDTRRLYLACYSRAVEPYLGRNLSLEDIRRLKPRAETQFLRMVAGDAHLDACLEDFHRAHRELYEEYFDGLFPGVVGLLDRLREAGVPLGLVTGKSRRSWEATPAREELGPFDVMVFEEDVPAPKPDPAGIRAALGGLGAAAGPAIYVGDTMGDVEAAIAAEVTPILGTWGLPADRVAPYGESARAAGALVVPSPLEVLDLLDLSLDDAAPSRRAG